MSVKLLIVWIDGLLYKLFTEFDIRGRMWLAIKDLYTDIRGQVFTDVRGQVFTEVRGQVFTEVRGQVFTPSHCPENLTFHKELVRGEY